MTLLIVDEEKCRKDGICAAECPMGIIGQQHGEGMPELVPGGEDVCLSCGHCVAVCPHGAMSHARVPMDTCPPVKKALMSDIFRSTFLNTMKKGIHKQGMGWITEI